MLVRREVTKTRSEVEELREEQPLGPFFGELSTEGSKDGSTDEEFILDGSWWLIGARWVITPVRSRTLWCHQTWRAAGKSPN